MIAWEIGTVVQCLSCGEAVQEVLVTMEDSSTGRAVYYLNNNRPLDIGDQVMLNTTTAKLKLGSGGVHFVADVRNFITPNRIKHEESHKQGHIVKLRYTPMQRVVLAVEEEASPFHSLFQKELSLEAMPVLIGELHSMLPIAMCWIRHRRQQQIEAGVLALEQPRIAYIMSDGAALPIAWSKHVAKLEESGWLNTTITYGQAYGGKLEAVNKFTALLAARHAAAGDITIVTMGPGIVGTGTPLGHSALEVGELVNAVHALGGVPIVIPRISFADSRQRHQGISHHTLVSLQTVAQSSAILPIPLLASKQAEFLSEQLRQYQCHLKHQVISVSTVDWQEVEDALKLYPEPITTMGRGLHNDDLFFLSVCCAAELAWVTFLQNKSEGGPNIRQA
jgi:hypothetical protein